jgi:uncharacterized protein (DUF362 family)
MDLFNTTVSVYYTKDAHYPVSAPFDPPVSYPEYVGDGIDRTNHVYAEVREVLHHLNLDIENYNTKQWNPFGAFISPGMTVFIKPNTVVHEHTDNKDVFSVIVHGSVLRVIIDYVCIALKGEGRVIIGDSQLYSSHFAKAMDAAKIGSILDWYSGRTKISFECIDLRMNKAYRTYLYGRWGRKPVEQDPRGYRFVDLGELSYFRDIDPKRLRIAIASYKNMIKHHSNGNHEYLFPGSFLESEAVISIPKLKTHRRTAVTLALKNFMGLPSWKDSLPHFITGSPAEGGDQYIHPSIRKRICTVLHDRIQSNPYIPVKFVCAVTKKIIWNSHKILPFKDDVYEAMWYGNDTLWRTLLDLNRAALYADKEGKLRSTQQRSFFGLIDGIIAGEKNGPLRPDPVPAGVLIGGFNPVALDAVGATLMGFDIAKIPLITKGFEDRKQKCPLYPAAPAEDINIANEGNQLNLTDLATNPPFKFEPHPGWKGHVELDFRN